jgi:hypothetical protein
MVDASLLSQVSTEAKAADGDLVEEARLAFEASRRVGGDGWRDLYLRHFAAAHDLPAPSEHGVLQAGDRVMRRGRSGAALGLATVSEIEALRTLSGAATHRVTYVLDAPVDNGDESHTIGAACTPEGVVHARDWPATMLGEDVAFSEIRVGTQHVPVPVINTMGR